MSDVKVDSVNGAEIMEKYEKNPAQENLPAGL